MTHLSEIRLAAPISGVSAFMEPHRQWIESVLGCETSNAITFDVEVPFGHLVVEDILKGVVLDRQCLSGVDALRPVVVRWELPPGISPKIQIWWVSA